MGRNSRFTEYTAYGLTDISSTGFSNPLRLAYNSTRTLLLLDRGTRSLQEKAKALPSPERPQRLNHIIGTSKIQKSTCLPFSFSSPEPLALWTPQLCQKEYSEGTMPDDSSNFPGRHDSGAAIVPFSAEESRSGIAWRYTREGSNLVTRSFNEATCTSQEADLARRLYVDGVAYFLRGLPSDLTPEERLRLGITLPPQLEPKSRANSPETVILAGSEDERANSSPKPNLSPVRTIVSRVTVGFIVLLRVLMRCLGLLVHAVYNYDRKHGISDRAVVQGILLLEWLWKAAYSLVGRACRIGEGRAGRFVTEISRCLVEEASNGLHDGMNEVLRKDSAVGGDTYR